MKSNNATFYHANSYQATLIYILMYILIVVKNKDGL